MLVLPIVVLLVIGIAVVMTSASERPRLLHVLGVGGLLVVLLAVAVAGVGLRDAPEHEGQDPTPPSSQRQEADVVVRPGRRPSPLDRLPDQGSRRVAVRVSNAVVLQQCGPEGVCAPATAVRPSGGAAVTDVRLRRDIGPVDCGQVRCQLMVTRVGSGELVAAIPLSFGRAAPVRPTPRPAPLTPRPPSIRPELPAGRLAVGLTGAAVLLAAAAWLVRRRPDERADDPFWDVSLAVPEWEGVSLDVDEEELSRR